eukprot:TRINITY_DN184_c0_g2_i3.p1 TRINITY_DN184_c0_g2~~TRINITY_DN184_c0_g2_i3.p1  ORF type:complete len:200 (-),score=27.82 TRINITY_DN184_c0_g2_i3:45-644(-)
MKATFILLLGLYLLSVAIAQQPSRPVWPTAFSASVEHRRHEPFERHEPRFHRFYYDSVKNKDKITGIEEWHAEYYWTERIFDHNIQREYTVYLQRGSSVCFYRSINTTLPKPNFANVNYIGQSLINYEPVYHWIETDRTRGITFQYFETVKYREPKRIEVSHDREGRSETWNFFEFDSCPQDPELFDLPAAVRNTCNPY